MDNIIRFLMEMNKSELFFVLVIVAMCLVLVFLFVLKKKNKDHDKLFEEFEVEAVASLSKVEKELQQEKKKQVEEVKKSYENKIKEFKEYVHSVEKISRTDSEIYTHKMLTEINEKLVQEGAIKPLQMKILANVYIPIHSPDAGMLLTKIDHLILMKTGVYIIDTQEVYGDVIYGIKKEKAKEYPLVFNKFFPSEEKDDIEKTIIIVNDNNNRNGINIFSLDDPLKQVTAGIETIKQEIRKKNHTDSIIPIVYFNHHGNSLINYSQNKIPYVFCDKQQLYEFFSDQLENYNYTYSEVEIEKMNNIIENVSLNH